MEQKITTEASPEGVEVVYRGTDSKKIRMMINHNAQEVKNGEITLAPFECRIDRM